jgi:hypothetical protein
MPTSPEVGECIANSSQLRGGWRTACTVGDQRGLTSTIKIPRIAIG